MTQKHPIFITGNQSKADLLAKYLGIDLEHQKVDLDEIQSLDPHVVIDHKVRQAYAVLKRPVLVEDTSLEFTAFGRFPGTLIRHFIDETSMETVCRSLDSLDRGAVARCIFGYYDGENVTFIEGEQAGTIAQHPRGSGGFGWDQIFVPHDTLKTRAEMDENEYEASYMVVKPFAKLREFLRSLEVYI
jgi:non-canonical purine NTP pyrophosphatase (RdgB/HAM1 family)